MPATFPVKRGSITSRFGVPRPGREPHKGLDIAAKLGEPVLAILPGVVFATYKTGELSAYGNLIVLKHGPDAYSLYAHLSQILVTPGQIITQSEPIGAVGMTAGTRNEPEAQTTAPHLHLETLTAWPPASRYADRVNPETVLAHDFGPELEPERFLAIRPYKPSTKHAASFGALLALIAAAALLKRPRQFLA